jgi:RNA polymerase sigma-70 factor (ECF subfamily)
MAASFLRVTRTMAFVASEKSSCSATSPTLLSGIAAKDPAAWQTLVDLYGPLVLYWIRRQGLSEHDAADVLQEVFVGVSTSIPKFRRDQSGSFRGWLWVITRNHLARFFRHRAENVRAVGGTDAWMNLAALAQSLSDDPDEHTEQTAMNELYRRGLNLVRSEFETRSWEIFWRAAVDQVATADVAAEFGTTTNSVRQTKSRILRRLRQVLGESSS